MAVIRRLWITVTLAGVDTLRLIPVLMDDSSVLSAVSWVPLTF